MRVKNIVWNVGGLGIPLVIAALTVPSLIESIGVERFGLLALAWGLIGFAGIFDLGIGRATTRQISRLRGENKLEDVLVVIKTAESLSLRSGLVAAVVLSIFVLFDVHGKINYDKSIHGEVTLAGFFLALAIPAQSMSAMFRGVNEAFENFFAISLVRIGLGVANFLGPFLVSIYSNNVALLVFTLLFSRCVALILFRYTCGLCVRDHLGDKKSYKSVLPSPVIARELLVFGGWFTVSSVVNPLLMQADRYVIGGLISASAVATYTIPYDIVTQSLIVAGAMTTVIFPSLSALAKSNPLRVKAEFNKWLVRITLVMFAVAMVIFQFLPGILDLWLKESVNPDSKVIGQVLSLGLVPYTIGTMHVALIHAANRPDVTGKSHLIQMPFFLYCVWWAVQHYGALGAASVWVIRVSIDALIMVVWSVRHLSSNLKISKT